ncbi:MAG: hypothetical protein R3B92_01795 [Patescibacteria group bacterium]
MSEFIPPYEVTFATPSSETSKCKHCGNSPCTCITTPVDDEAHQQRILEEHDRAEAAKLKQAERERKRGTDPYKKS